MKLTMASFRKMIEFTLLHNTDTEKDILDFAQKTRDGGYACAYGAAAGRHGHYHGRRGCVSDRRGADRG